MTPKLWGVYLLLWLHHDPHSHRDPHPSGLYLCCAAVGKLKDTHTDYAGVGGAVLVVLFICESRLQIEGGGAYHAPCKVGCSMSCASTGVPAQFRLHDTHGLPGMCGHA